MRLTKAILLRLLYGILSLLFISLVTFFAGYFSPADAARIIVGEKASKEAYLAKKHELGLDRGPFEQFGSYVASASQGDLGHSWYGMQEPVSKMIGDRAPITIKVAVLAILLASIIGITLGTVAALYRSRAPDVGVLTVSTLGVTVPNFVLLPILIYLFANQMGYLPGDANAGRNAPEIYSLILPVVVLAARPMALLTRLTRASMIDTLQQEFIKTATAKGVPPARLIFKHGLRNAILPVISAIGVNFGFLLTGSFVVERVYAMPGLGSLAIEAVMQRNNPVIQGTVLAVGGLFIGMNLLVDIVLPILDPRIREAQV